VHAKAVLCLERAGVFDELLGRAHFAAPAGGIVVAEEEIARELHFIAQLAAEQRVNRHAEPLADEVEARELDRRVQLRAVVVEARRRIADLEAERLELERIVADEVLLQPDERELRGLAAAAHFPQPDEAVVGLDLDDRAHEPAPVGAVRVPERRLERHRDGGRPDVDDLHSGSATAIWARSPPSTRSSVPVTKLARSLARNAIASATSSARATRPSGCARPHVTTVSSTVLSPLKRPAAHRSIGVSTEPGQRALQRMLSAAWSIAIAFVSATIAPLLAA
jgi:hypothetical protein